MPNEISLWLTSLLLKLPVKEQLQEAHTTTTLGCVTVFPSTSDLSVSATTSSLTPSQDPNDTRSLAPLPWLSGRDNFWDQLMTPWLWAQSEITSQVYLRPLGKTANQTKTRRTTLSLASFYNASSKPTRMPAQWEKAKSHPRLCDCQNCQAAIDGAAVCNLATHHSCLILCHAFLQ